MKKIVLVLFVSALLVYGCGGSSEESTEEVKKEVGCVPDSVSYANDVWPIIQAHCLECHNEDDYKEKGEGNKLYDYKSVKKMVDAGFVYGNIAHLRGYKPMPDERDQLDSCTIAIVKRWIDQGANEN